MNRIVTKTNRFAAVAINYRYKCLLFVSLGIFIYSAERVYCLYFLISWSNSFPCFQATADTSFRFHRIKQNGKSWRIYSWVLDQKVVRIAVARLPSTFGLVCNIMSFYMFLNFSLTFFKEKLSFAFTWNFEYIHWFGIGEKIGYPEGGGKTFLEFYLKGSYKHYKIL